MSSPLCSLTSGALSEIAAAGQQDVHLFCNATETLWVQSYARITNFALAEQDVCLSNPPTGAWSSVSCASVEVPRAGDLLADAYFVAKLQALTQPASTVEAHLWTPAVGMALLKNVRLSIGSQLFEDLTDTYQMMFDEVHRPEGKRLGLQAGDYGMYLRAARELAETGELQVDRDEATLRAGLEYSTRDQHLNVRLPLHFTHSPGNALNIVGLQYHQVNIELTLRGRDELVLIRDVERGTAGGAIEAASSPTGIVGGAISDAKIRLLFVHLDTPERRVQAQQPRTVMMVYPQNQEISVADGATSVQARNYFNHPTTEFMWAYRSRDAELALEYFRFGAYSGAVTNLGVGTVAAEVDAREVIDAISTFDLSLNNHKRICGNSAYFHEAVPQARSARKPSRLVSQYSFAVDASDKSRYTGSLNLSRIDNVVIDIGFRAEGSSSRDEVQPGQIQGKVFLHGSTINFYRIAGGMAGLMFAN